MKKTVYLFLLLFVLTTITCRKPGERDTVDSYSLKEDLDSIPLVVGYTRRISQISLNQFSGRMNSMLCVIERFSGLIVKKTTW
jgi:hypothetical protein